MAMTQDLVATVTYAFRDERGAPATIQAYIPAVTTLAAATTAADTLRSSLQSLSGCVITGQSITYGFHDPVPAAPVADVWVDDKGVFTFNAGSNLTTSMQIPGFLGAAVETSGRIDDDQADVSELVSGITGGVWVSKAGIDIVSLRSAIAVRRTTPRSRQTKNKYPD